MSTATDAAIGTDPMENEDFVEVDPHHDPIGDKVGMWLFLFTEIILFGGLFIVYAVYRSSFPDAFHTAAAELNPLMGAVNTAVLLTSSLTMALSIVALQRKNKPLCLSLMGATLLCGLVFMVIKYFEWSHKIHLGIYPGSEELARIFTGQEVIFFSLYYAMTGLHGIHVVIGMTLIAVMMFAIAFEKKEKVIAERTLYSEPTHGEPTLHVRVDGPKGKEVAGAIEVQERDARLEVTVREIQVIGEHPDAKSSHLGSIENTGLYWHLVDLIWIYLFPLFYLIT